MSDLGAIRARLLSWVEGSAQAMRSATAILAEFEAEVRRLERRTVLAEMATPSDSAANCSESPKGSPTGGPDAGK